MVKMDPETKKPYGDSTMCQLIEKNQVYQNIDKAVKEKAYSRLSFKSSGKSPELSKEEIINAYLSSLKRDIFNVDDTKSDESMPSAKLGDDKESKSSGQDRLDDFFEDIRHTILDKFLEDDMKKATSTYLAQRLKDKGKDKSQPQ